MSNPALSPAALSPAMFSVVLATGGLSLNAHMLGHLRVASALFWLNFALFICAWTATLLRKLYGFRALLDDCTHAGRGPAFFLSVLATSIFGLQVAVVAQWPGAVMPIWIFSAVLWVGLLCGFTLGMAIREDKPALAAVISPAWLLPGAALEATVALGTHALPNATGIPAIALQGGYLLGLLLNVLALAAVIYRWMFAPMSAEQLVATNWINMGGFAIIVVAGVKLGSAQGSSLIFLCWTIATLWIPILVAAGLWRHAVRKVPLRYDAQYWPVVFSPSVYASATFLLAESTHVSALHWLPPVFVVFAFAVWLILMIGLARSFLPPAPFNVSAKH